MALWKQIFAPSRNYIASAAMALICAALLSALGDVGPLPIFGQTSLLWVVVCAAIAGFPLLGLLQRRGLGNSSDFPVQMRNVTLLLAIGALLAIPPILIDTATVFRRDINVLPPIGLLYYPAVALVAEVSFHLAPMAFLVSLTSKGSSTLWALSAVVFVEPLFQAIQSSTGGVQAWLVFGNVGLVSAAQIMLFVRYGFGAMIGLRLAFYFFWHVCWGLARLPLLF